MSSYHGRLLFDLMMLLWLRHHVSGWNVMRLSVVRAVILLQHTPADQQVKCNFGFILLCFLQGWHLAHRRRLQHFFLQL